MAMMGCSANSHNCLALAASASAYLFGLADAERTLLGLGCQQPQARCSWQGAGAANTVQLKLLLAAAMLEDAPHPKASRP
jgi:hypothetical protein